MKRPKTPRGTWTFCGSTGVLFEDRLLNWCVTQRCNVSMAMRKHLCSWPGLTMLAVQIFWGKTLVYGGKQKPRDEWYWNWNLEHGHKNCLENDGCFFSKDSKGVVFSQKFGDKDFQYMCCTPKAKKSIWMCCHLQSIWIRMLNPNNNCGKCQGFDPTWVFLAFVKNDFGSKPELWVKLS